MLPRPMQANRAMLVAQHKLSLPKEQTATGRERFSTVLVASIASWHYAKQTICSSIL